MKKLEKKHVLEWTQSMSGGVQTKLTAMVSMCSWNYSSYGLHIQVHAEPGGSYGSYAAKQVKFDDATVVDFDKLTTLVEVDVCAREDCTNAVFLNACGDGRTKLDLCQICRIVEFQKEHEAEEKKQAFHHKQKDMKMKKQGATHKVIACVHPAAGGDDFLVIIYTKQRLTNEQIETKLKQEGSCVFDDFKQIAL